MARTILGGATAIVTISPRPRQRQSTTVPLNASFPWDDALLAGAHVLRVFVDAALLKEGGPVTPYSLDVGCRAGGTWLFNASSRLRSGTHINVFELREKAVAGVVTGGTKEPLGAIV